MVGRISSSLGRWQPECVTHWHGSLFVRIVRGITNQEGEGGLLLLLSSPVLSSFSLSVISHPQDSEGGVPPKHGLLSCSHTEWK